MIVEANKVSKNIYFIISGHVHIMNETCKYRYATITEGSYFGDISMLNGKQSEFGYFYNPNGKPTNLMKVDGQKFMNICN